MNRSELEADLRQILNFWEAFLINPEHGWIYPALSLDNKPDEKADMGSMYLSRILYGASEACLVLKTQAYLNLAEKAHAMLRTFENPAGGYYWARGYQGTWIHDADNVNMGQAFALYGLLAYAEVRPSESVHREIERQLAFIRNVISAPDREGFLDGFDMNWEPMMNQTRVFGTHLHMLEALVKYYRINEKRAVISEIESLIRLILDQFIGEDGLHCLHRLTADWGYLPNEFWAGHDAECSWILCDAAACTGNAELIQRTDEKAVAMMDEVIRCSRDVKRGGYANLIVNCTSAEKSKTWWPQAEVVLGLLNCHRITGEGNYIALAEEQVHYIRRCFLETGGEWFSEVSHTGQPFKGAPKVFFWKSMYHNVRYYSRVLAYLAERG